jgi:hypothetical protein
MSLKTWNHLKADRKHLFSARWIEKHYSILVQKWPECFHSLFYILNSAGKHAIFELGSPRNYYYTVHMYEVLL